jgi:hypothetical protein
MNWVSSIWLNFIDNSINVINFNELSFIHMVICIYLISMLFTCSCFFLYQYSKCMLSIAITWTSFIDVFQFHPSHFLSLMLSVSSKGWDSNIWSNYIHVKIHRKATSSTIWPNFIHAIKFIQMYHPCSQKFHGFHRYHLIFISRLIPYWHQCHACGKTQFPVKLSNISII